MKGKRTDSEFVSNFIENCICNNIFLAEDMLNLAKSKILEIDKKIIEAENLKKIRSKLLDVVSNFESNKSINMENSKILHLFNVKDKNLSCIICNAIKQEPAQVLNFYEKGYSVSDINFCIKQLIELKVIHKVGNFLLPDVMFDSYINNVMCENK